MSTAPKSNVKSPGGKNGNTTLSFYAAVLAVFFGASTAPTPLYRIYQESWDFSPVLITVIFSVYAFALLISLLIVGSISDHLGRRPVIFGSLVVLAVAMVLFIVADSPEWLIAARIVQGFATGAAGASIGAALVDVSRTKGPIVNSIAPLSGMAIGALCTSILIEFGPEPLHLVYVVFLVAVIILAVLIWRIPETVVRRPGALASLKPQVSIPPNVRKTLLSITPINIAVWTLGGYYLSLIPSLISATTGNHSPIVGGMVVAALTLSGAAAVFALRQKSADVVLHVGVSSMTLGIAMLVVAVHLGLVPLLLLGTIFAGAGFGSNFLGSISSIMPLAAADERAGLLSAFYIQSYLAFSLPAILAGFLAHNLGYTMTTDIYAVAIVTLMLAGLASYRATRFRAVNPS